MNLRTNHKLFDAEQGATTLETVLVLALFVFVVMVAAKGIEKATGDRIDCATDTYQSWRLTQPPLGVNSPC